MKPFDIELAKQGYPLIDKDGNEYEFLKFDETELKCPLILYCKTTKTVERYTKDGKYAQRDNDNLYDLYLDDSKEWQPEPKEGDWVEVYNKIYDRWYKRVFLCKLKNGQILTVTKLGTDSYFNNGNYDIVKWDKMRPIKKDTIEIIVKVNGKTVPLSDISEETLLKIRNNESI